MKFKIGDYVRVKEGAMGYRITKSGSTGHIMAFKEDYKVRISFDKLTGAKYDYRPQFEIYISDIELYKKEIKIYGIVNFIKENYK